ncbi:MAG: hypothetical protein MUE52_10780 [Tabrizicola sp.]|jgi:hypothetical protein|nr:hypothetical protein [Tabrizicola sp.]
MTGPSASPPDVSAAVQALKPQLTRMSVWALLGMTVSGIVTLYAVIASITLIEENSDGDRFKVALFAGIMGILLMAFIYGRMRRSQEALVMPHVAQAVGLTYYKDASGFLNALPERLLPRASVRKAEDLVVGQLGSHSIQLAEVSIETGGKNSRTLFKGVVAQFRNSIQMPAFFLAPHEQTRPGMIFKAWIPTDGLYHQRDVVGPSGTTYGLWTSWTDAQEAPALNSVVDILTSLENRLPGPMSLFTATSNGIEMHIALRHFRDLYRVGGLFPAESHLLSQVSQATQDLSVPLNLVKELVAAELAVADQTKTG